MTDTQADGGGKRCADQHAEPWGQAVVLQEQRRGVGANSVINSMPQRKLTGATAEDVPGRRKRAENTYRDDTCTINVESTKAGMIRRSDSAASAV